MSKRAYGTLGTGLINSFCQHFKRSGKRSPLFLVMLSFGALFVSGCSTSSEPIMLNNDIVIHDPYEEYNRKAFSFNDKLSDALIHPVVEGYRAVVPKPARTGLRNFLRNIRTPVNFANEVLQGDVAGAEKVATRAVINTLIGVGGVFDVAGYEGIEYEAEDFGQTLAVWGVDHGPYLVVPLIGPSSARDYTGYFADSLMDPMRWYLFNVDQEPLYYAKLGADYLDLRDAFMDVLLDLEASSLDYYAAVRATYYQNRHALVKDSKGSMSDDPIIPDYDLSMADEDYDEF